MSGKMSHPIAMCSCCPQLFLPTVYLMYFFYYYYIFFLNSGFITVFLPRWEMAKLSQLAVTSVVSQHGERRRRGQWQPLFSSHRLRFPPPTCYLGEVRPAAARSRGGGIRGEKGGGAVRRGGGLEAGAAMGCRQGQIKEARAI